MADIFISYRRSDSSWATGRIADRLDRQFGDGAVFLDTLTIGLGEDFVDAIGERLESCRVLLPVIGGRWLDEIRKRRRHDNDLVRIEIREALRRGVKVVPLFIDDTAVPPTGKLPKEIASLSRMNGLRIRADAFSNDIQPLLSLLDGVLNEEAEESFPPRAAAPPSAPREAASAPAIKPILSLQPRTEYWKRGADGRPRYRIYVHLAGPDGLLKQVEKVVYRLHSSFKNPIREIFDRESNFELKTNGWGGFEISAHIYFKDETRPPAWLSAQVEMPRDG